MYDSQSLEYFIVETKTRENYFDNFGNVSLPSRSSNFHTHCLYDDTRTCYARADWVIFFNNRVTPDSVKEYWIKLSDIQKSALPH